MRHENDDRPHAAPSSESSESAASSPSTESSASAGSAGASASAGSVRSAGSVLRGLHPAEWALWHRPVLFVAVLIVAEIIALAGFAIAISSTDAPSMSDWLHLAILLAGATVHIQLTRRQEERRRNRMQSVLIDLIAVWVFPAVLVLPPKLVIVLIVAVRAQRWFVARRPAHNFVYSSIAHCFAAVLAGALYHALGPATWSELTLAASLREVGLVLVAAVVYEGVQLIYVGGIIALSTPKPTVRQVFGSRADNVLEAITTGLGAITAVLLVTLPPMVLVMAVVTVVFNRLAEIEQLQADATTDPKTGLRNMRGWSESAERALGRIRRADGTLAVLMIDLDHFKWVNDTYGHPAGDDMLGRVADVLRDVTRPADIVGRFGGEEFLLLLPDTDTDGAHHVAERIRTTIAALRIDTTDKRGSRVVIAHRTASIGLAVYPVHATTLDGLTQAADAAVYEAKEAGRDNVRLAPPLDR